MSRPKHKHGWFLPLFALAGLLAMAVRGAEASAATIDAMDMLLTEREKIVEHLDALAPSYGGEQPEELVSLIALGLSQQDRLADGQGGSAESLREGYWPVIGRAFDLLYEWPSDDLSDAVRTALGEPTGRQLHAGLLAAAAAADDPAVAASTLDAIARTVENGDDSGVVLGLLALGESRNPAMIPQLEGFLDDPLPARREAASRALHRLRVMLGLKTVPPLDASAAAPTACMVGADLFADYRSLPRQPVTHTTASLGFLAISLHMRNPSVDAATMDAMTRTLTDGGTVLIVKPMPGEWPVALQQWAAQSGAALPDALRDAHGTGIVRYEDYRSFADYPYELRDQPGRAANVCWGEWKDSLEAPVLAGNGAGALVVVQEPVLGKGRLVMTTVDLATRPIYRENLLRWVYGDALLAHAFDFTNAYDFRPTGHTDHVPWLRPIAGRKPKVLYLTGGMAKRNLLELLQRVDVEWRYVPYDASFALPPVGKDALAPPARMAQRAVCLLEEAIPWADVMVFDVVTQNLIRSLTRALLGGMSFDTVPARLRRAVYRRVHKDGVGLLGSGGPRSREGCLHEFSARMEGDDRDQDRLRVLASTMTPFGNPGGVVSGRRGRGRLLWFDHVPGKGNAVPGLFDPQYPVDPDEYRHALLARCVLWTTGREDFPRLARVEARSPGAGRPVEVRLAFCRPFIGTCEIAFRDAYDTRSPAVRVRVDGNQAVFEAPALPVGSHVAEIRLADADGRMVDAAAVRLDVAGPVRIVAIETDRRFYGTGETARLTVRLSAPFAGSVRVEAVDTYGRRVFATDRLLESPEEACTVDMPIDHPLSRLWDAVATLHDGDRIVSRIRQPIGIRLPPPELDFDVAASVSGAPASFFRDRMAANVTGGDPETAIRNHLELTASYGAGTIAPHTTPGARLNPNEREPCLSSPAFRLKALRAMRQASGRLRDLGMTDYAIDDESPLGGRCFAPPTLSRFRIKMRELYGSLDALNREWGTTFPRWDDVQPCRGGSDERPGPYVDFDVFTSWVFAEYCSFLEMVAGDAVGQFRAGQSGGISDNLMMHLAGALFYYGVNEQAVSMKRPDAVIGCWYGPGYRFIETHETASRHWPWWHLFRGTTRIQLWYPPEGGPPGFHEDLSRPYRAFTWLNEEMEDIRLGVGKLLMHCRRDDGRAAVYLSQRSRIVRAALKEIQSAEEGAAPAQGLFRDISRRAGNLLRKAFLSEQVECRFLSEFQAEAGEIEKRGLRLIVMPGAISLSAREREVLERFVHAGGVLVVGETAGTRNDHGTRLPVGFPRELLGAEVRTPTDKDPIAAAMPVGKGAVVVVNFADFVDSADEPGASGARRKLVRDLIRLADLRPVVSVTGANKRPVDADFGVFASGEALYAGFVTRGQGGLLNAETSMPVTVALPAVAHLYDARHGGYLGRTDTWQTNVIPAVAQVYAALPWRMEALDVRPSHASVAPGDVLECAIRARVEGPAPGLQVWLLRVRGPDGAEQSAHTRRLLARGGETKISIPLAIDALPGMWDIAVRDAATGAEGRAPFEVKEVRP